MCTTTLYIVYLIKSKPFKEYSNSTFEIINEYFICVGAMYIMMFTNDAFDSDTKVDIGLFYLSFNAVSLAVIFKTLLADFLFTTIPSYF